MAHRTLEKQEWREGRKLTEEAAKRREKRGRRRLGKVLSEREIIQWSQERERDTVN